MKKVAVAVALLLASIPFSPTGQEAKTFTGDDLKWGPASPALPTGRSRRCPCWRSF